MNRSRLCVAALVALLCVAGASSCKKKATATPPAPKPAVAVEPSTPPRPPEPVSEPQTTATLPPPQEVPDAAVPDGPTPLAGDAGRLPSYRDIGVEEPGKPPEQTAVEPRRPEPSEPELGQVPRLGQVLTAEQRREWNRMIDRSLAAARSDLDLVVEHALTPEQVSAVRRIRAFIRQAEQARTQDLSLAKNLADRAQLLARDLARGFR